jgi:4-hydroxybenzoate polyprenyltransferase
VVAAFIFQRARRKTSVEAIHWLHRGSRNMENSRTLRLVGGLNSDRSVTFLLLSNLFTIVLAVLQQWDVHVLMWIYWGQSVVIGYFNVHRILDLEEFSTEGFRVNNKAVAPTPETQRETAVFFALHYGFFHLGYLVFLLVGYGLQGAFTIAGIALCILAFYFNHRFSYHYNREREREGVPNIGSIMFFPYVRIIPMHLMIIMGGVFLGSNSIALVLFLLLKTAADVAMHVIEHAMARARAKRATRRLP